VKEDVEVRLKVLEEKRKSLEEKNQGNGGPFQRCGEEDKTGRVGKIESSQRGPSRSQKALGRMGDLYKDSYETYQKRDLEGAKEIEAFLKQYPNTELSGNAQFWIGETYYQRKDFERAILEYEKAITKYPESG